ncbi:serine protease 55 [Ictidomys tridecemlineatus]|nr:serine protease 55 [Ictidomys tridecemlineatus]
MLLFSVVLLITHATGADPGCGERPTFEDRKMRHSRIVGGLEAEVGEFPWQVSIQATNQHFCGGTILNSWWILTAAHCVIGELPTEELSVVLGTNDLTSPRLEIKPVSSIVYHNKFKRESMDNDIALLMVASPIEFNSLTVPICMPPEPMPSKWHKCWVAGWGQTTSADKGSMKTDLLKAPMVIIDWNECAKTFTKLTKNMLCAGFMNESYDACQGDSGGPLVCTTEGSKKWYQVGIISWGRSCGQKNTPGIYTSLANYQPWIRNVTQVEGRPLDTEHTRSTLKHKSRDSRSSGCSELGSPRRDTESIPPSYHLELTPQQRGVPQPCGSFGGILVVFLVAPDDNRSRQVAAPSPAARPSSFPPWAPEKAAGRQMSAQERFPPGEEVRAHKAGLFPEEAAGALQ